MDHPDPPHQKIGGSRAAQPFTGVPTRCTPAGGVANSLRAEQRSDRRTPKIKESDLRVSRGWLEPSRATKARRTAALRLTESIPLTDRLLRAIAMLRYPPRRRLGE